MIKNLPLWNLTSLNPAIYDNESGSAIEMTAKVYGKMQELVNDYNEFVNKLNNAITDHNNSVDKDIDAFKCAVTELLENYIRTIDLKVIHIDSSVSKIIKEEFDKLNIEEIVNNIINNIDLSSGTKLYLHTLTFRYFANENVTTKVKVISTSNNLIYQEQSVGFSNFDKVICVKQDKEVVASSGSEMYSTILGLTQQGELTFYCSPGYFGTVWLDGMTEGYLMSDSVTEL